MKAIKIALLGTAALVAVSVSARAESLDALKASMNDLTIGAVADAPAAAAPAAVVAWSGRTRAAVVAFYNPTAAAPYGNYGVNILANGHLDWTATTQTAVGEVGVVGSAAYGVATGNALVNNGYNGGNSGLSADGFNAYWKMTPTTKLVIGNLGNLSKSGYSWDAIAANWFAGKTGGGVTASQLSGDPAAIQLAYADGPLGFAVQVEDGNNNVATSASAFGLSAKIGYKMDAFGIDLNGGYWGDAVTNLPGWSVSAGLGYSAGPLGFGASFGTGTIIGTSTTYTPGSAYAKLGLSDSARIEMGVTRDFATGANVTTFGGGIYYSPVKQLTFGAEAGYVSNGANNGAYSAGLVSAFTF